MISEWGVAQRVFSQSILASPAPDAPTTMTLAAIGHMEADVDVTQEDVITPLRPRSLQRVPIPLANSPVP